MVCVKLKRHAKRNVREMINVMLTENAHANVEKMLNAMLGESVFARKRDKNFLGAVEKIAKEREAFVTRKQEDVGANVGADDRVGNVGGVRKYIQDVLVENVGIVELLGNAIEWVSVLKVWNF